jgi:hypothetical protein
MGSVRWDKRTLERCRQPKASFIHNAMRMIITEGKIRQTKSNHLTERKVV